MLDEKSALERLENFRNDYKDTLPSYRVLPWNDPDYYLYKCRGGFMAGVRALLSRIIEKQIVTDAKTIESGKIFMEYIKERDWERFTTREEINMANSILDAFIENIKKRTEDTLT